VTDQPAASFAQWPLATLKRAPRNPKHHDLPALGDAIERFGYVAPMIINSTSGQLVAGHGRLDALLKRKKAGKPAPRFIELDAAGDWLIPVRLIPFASEDEAEAYLLADNQQNQLAGNDKQKLAELLDDLGRRPLGLVGTGYKASDYDQLMLELGKKNLRADERELPESLPARAQLGDIWQLGQHRLIVGSSLDQDAVDRVFAAVTLPGGKRTAGLICTDPPFNVGFKFKGAYAGQDEKTPEEYQAFLRTALAVAEAHLVEGGCVFCWQGLMNVQHYAAWFAGKDWRLFACVKDFVQARPAWMQWSWDPIVCYTKGERKVKSFPGVRDWFHAKNSDTSKTPDRLLQRHHPCPRPLDTIEYILLTFSSQGDLVFDGFTGSGTCLIAAERTQRVFVGCELEPRYADVAITRWETLTGRQATVAR